MKTELILVGKTVNKHFIAGIKDYAERITHYMPFNITKVLRNDHRLQAHGAGFDAAAAADAGRRLRQGGSLLAEQQQACLLYTSRCV